MARKDQHRPAVIKPADYQYVGCQYVKVEGLGDALFLQEQRENIRRHMEMTGGGWSTHEHGGNCHICGAHAVYLVVFYHQPTNTYIKTGLECANNLDEGEAALFQKRVRAALEHKKGKAKAEAILAAKGLSAAWAVFLAPAAPSDRKEEITIRDIVDRLARYGSITLSQENYVRGLLDRIARRAEIDAEDAAKRAAVEDVPDIGKDRVMVRGRIISIKDPDPEADRHNRNYRLLIQADEGYRVFGNRPRGFDGFAVGDRIEFLAYVKPSKTDPKFGYFNFGIRAKILEKAEATKERELETA